jgi:predicted transcriptional regulator
MPPDFAENCRKAKFRNANRFIQDRVWRWLKRQKEPASLQEGVMALGLSVKAVSNALYLMRRRGCAVCKRQGTHSRWLAIGSCPENMRGIPAKSVANLDPQIWLESMPKAHLALGRSIDLLSATIQRQKVPELVRERAPAKSVQVPTLADLASQLIGPS